MPGQNILECVVVLHETIHELYTKLMELSLKWVLSRPTIKSNGLFFSKLFA